MMKSRYSFNTFLVVICITLLCSCTPTIKNFHSYNQVPFSKSSFLSEDSSKNGHYKKKVVIFKSNNNDKIDLDKNSVVSSLLIKRVEVTLEENKLVEFLDREAAKKLEKEIQLIEMKQTGIYQGPQVADYAIIVELSNISFDSKYIEGYQPDATTVATDVAIAIALGSSNNSRTYVPPKFQMTAKVEGNIKIYELPSMNVVKIIPFCETRRRTRDAVVERSGFLGMNKKVNTEELNKVDVQLISETSSETIDRKVQAELKQFFTQTGYIIEKRELRKGNKVKGTIFRIDLGSKDGIITKQKLDIIVKEKDYNPITEEEHINNVVIGRAVISDKVFDNSSWIIIKDEEIVDRIKLGSMVRVLYKK